MIKRQIDPRQEWPRVADFVARFRLPPQCVEQLTDEFEASPFRPGKGKDENRGSPIPLFHKVCAPPQKEYNSTGFCLYKILNINYLFGHKSITYIRYGNTHHHCKPLVPD